MADPRGRVLSSYTVLDELGRGAMGVVYKARHENDGSFAAVKFLAPDSSDSGDLDSAQRRFSDEVRALCAVSSPHVVKLLAAGNDTVCGKYVILEYLKGETLEDALFSGLHYSLEDFLRSLAVPLLEGLFSLHSAGVAHRDIKPSNLIARASGQYTISDFGLASFTGRQAKTRTGMIIGSPGYLAPECFGKHGQTKGSELERNIRSDIYSAAILLIEVLCGAHPFREKELSRTVQRQLEFDPTHRTIAALAQRQGRFIHSAVGKVLARGAAKNPEHRFATSADFLQALKTAGRNALVEDSQKNFESSNVTVEALPVHSTMSSKALPAHSVAVKKAQAKGSERAATSAVSPKEPPAVKQTRLKYGLLALLAIFLILSAVLASWNMSGAAGKTGSSVDSMLAAHQNLKNSYTAYTRAGQAFMAVEINPGERVLSEFYDSGSTLYRQLFASTSISPRQKAEIWKEANAGLDGLPLLLSQLLAKVSGNSKDAFGMLRVVDGEFKDSLRDSLKESDNTSLEDYQRAFGGVKWFVGLGFKVVLGRIESERTFRSLHALLCDAEYYITSIMPLQVNYSSRPFVQSSAPVRDIRDLAAGERFRLFVSRAALFSGLNPFDGLSRIPERVYASSSKMNSVLLYDAAHSIIRALENFLATKPPVPFSKEPVQELNSLREALVDRSEYQKAVVAITEQIHPLKAGVGIIPDKEFDSLLALDPSHPVFTAFNEFHGPVEYEQIHEVYQRIKAWASRIRSIGSSIQNIAIKDFFKGGKEHMANGGILVGQRAYWFYYPAAILQSSFVRRNGETDFLMMRVCSLSASLCPYLEGREPLGAFLDKQHISLAMGSNLLTASIVTSASIAVSYPAPENMWREKFKGDDAQLLTFHQYILSVLNSGIWEFSVCSTARDPHLSDILKRFNHRWDEAVLPAIHPDSLLYSLLNCNRLLTNYRGNDTLRIERALELSHQAFVEAKAYIMANGGSACPQQPYLFLLGQVVDVRWGHLRRFKKYEILEEESRWFLNLFHNTISQRVKEKDSGSVERLYAQAATSLGHICLERKDYKEFERSKVYLEKARDIISSPDSSMYPRVLDVLSGNTLY